MRECVNVREGSVLKTEGNESTQDLSRRLPRVIKKHREVRRYFFCLFAVNEILPVLYQFK